VQLEVQHSDVAAELAASFSALPYAQHDVMLAVVLELLEISQVKAAFELRGGRIQAVVFSVASKEASAGEGVKLRGEGRMGASLGAHRA
jgi:hypothetical protein